MFLLGCQCEHWQTQVQERRVHMTSHDENIGEGPSQGEGEGMTQMDSDRQVALIRTGGK